MGRFIAASLMVLLFVGGTAHAQPTHAVFDVRVQRVDGIIEDVYISIPREWARDSVGCVSQQGFCGTSFQGNAPFPPADQEPSFVITKVLSVRRLR